MGRCCCVPSSKNVIFFLQPLGPRQHPPVTADDMTVTTDYMNGDIGLDAPKKLNGMKKQPPFSGFDATCQENASTGQTHVTKRADDTQLVDMTKDDNRLNMPCTPPMDLLKAAVNPLAMEQDFEANALDFAFRRFLPQEQISAGEEAALSPDASLDPPDVHDFGRIEMDFFDNYTPEEPLSSVDLLEMTDKTAKALQPWRRKQHEMKARENLKARLVHRLKTIWLLRS